MSVLGLGIKSKRAGLVVRIAVTAAWSGCSQSSALLIEMCVKKVIVQWLSLRFHVFSVSWCCLVGGWYDGYCTMALMIQVCDVPYGEKRIKDDVALRETLHCCWVFPFFLPPPRLTAIIKAQHAESTLCDSNCKMAQQYRSALLHSGGVKAHYFSTVKSATVNTESQMLFQYQ